MVPIHQRVIASLAEHSLLSKENIENSLEDDEEDGKLFKFVSLYYILLTYFWNAFKDIDKSPELSDVCKEFYLEQNNEERLKKLGLVGRFAKSISSTVDMPQPFSKPFEVFIINYYFLNFVFFLLFIIFLGTWWNFGRTNKVQ